MRISGRFFALGTRYRNSLGALDAHAQWGGTMNYLIPITARHASKAGATLNLCISRAHGRTSDEGEVVTR